MIVYLVNNLVYIKNNGKLIKVKLEESVDKGYIINKEIFIEEFTKIISSLKIKNKLFGDKVSIVKNVYYSIGDLYYFENIFNELGFAKVEFLDIKNYLSGKYTYIEINDNYMIIYIDDGIFIDLKYFNDIKKILEMVKHLIKNHLVFFGTNKIIPEIRVKGIESFYFENCDQYIIDLLN